ncbi:TetR family transcriptional regulator C-terminal domain-containing protein [Thiolapillus sp.]
MEKVRRYLNEASSPLAGVKLFLQKITDEMVSDPSRRGCFLVNTVLEMSPDNVKIQETVTQQLDALENLLTAAFREAIDRAELANDKDPKTLAKFVMVNIWGLRVLSKTAADEKTIRQQLAQLLDCLERHENKCRS